MAAAPDDDALRARMMKLGLREEDLVESFVRGTGAGGQKINKTSSTVVLRHVVSGLEVRCQQQRSQSMNRLIARRELCDKLEQQREEVRLAKRAVVEKKKRTNRARPRGVKERILKSKRIRSEVKRGRAKEGVRDKGMTTENCKLGGGRRNIVGKRGVSCMVFTSSCCVVAKGVHFKKVSP